MRTVFRLVRALMHIIAWLVVALLLYSLVACRSIQYYPVETQKTDSIYIKQFERDSVYFKDSVFVHTKADTVFLTRTQFKYREIILRDTMHIVQCDTTTVVREVPREFTRMETLKMNIGGGVLWAIPFVVVFLLFILYCKLKR